MVKPASTTSTILTSSGNTSSNNNTDQQQQQQLRHLRTTSWHQLQTSESLNVDVQTKTNVERLKYLEKSPLFIYPHRLCFYVQENSCCRQEVKLINPYEWRINFQVLASYPERYEVCPAKGSIGPSRTIDISIRLLSENVRHLGQSTDVLRFQVTADDSTAMGSRYLPIQFTNDIKEYQEFKETLNTEPSADCKSPIAQQSSENKSHDGKKVTNKKSSTSKRNTQGAAASNDKTEDKSESKGWHPSSFFAIAVFCGIIIWLPSEGDNRHPTFMSISTTPKVVAAYILGVITTMIYNALASL